MKAVDLIDLLTNLVYGEEDLSECQVVVDGSPAPALYVEGAWPFDGKIYLETSE